MIRFETVIAIFVTLVSVIMTVVFVDGLGRDDTWVVRWFLPVLVMAFGWGTTAVMWLAILTGRELLK
jgi:hypothetical protein